jgi:predicted secreted protein
MTTQAQLAQGMTIQWGSFGAIAEVTNFSLGSTVDQVEVTNHDSVGRAREYIAGLFTPGETTFTVNYNATFHGELVDRAGFSELVDVLTVALPDNSDTFQVNAWVKGFTLPGPATGEALTMDVIFQTTGPVTRTSS